jgi:phospholipase C
MKFTSKGWFLLVLGLMTVAAYAQIPASTHIRHVIVIDQENRTVDNLFGSNSSSNQYYLPGLHFSTTGQAYTITNNVKTVFTVNAVSIPFSLETRHRR